MVSPSLSSSESGKYSTAYLSRVIENLKNMEHRNSTKNTYHKVWTKFNEFVIKLDSIPIKWEERVALYCGYLAQVKGRKPATIKSYVSAIKTTLQKDGYQWDNNLLLLSTFTRASSKINDKRTTRLPLKFKVFELFLFEVGRLHSEQPYLEILYKTAYCLAYYGMLRVGEITLSEHMLKARDVHKSDNGKHVKIVLHSSKTHNRGDRPQILVIDAVKNSPFCPVKIITTFAELRIPYNNDTDQFLVFRDGSNFLTKHFKQVMVKGLKRLGLEPSQYGTHSFRIGRATDLQRAGRGIDYIKKQGRWESNAVYNYLRT